MSRHYDTDTIGSITDDQNNDRGLVFRFIGGAAFSPPFQPNDPAPG